ncbi:AAA family ATPase [Eggerthella sp. YY7918]|uniref:AAA family ATPase n=1 Tax=Eggerthella sp. (strain YY7918) TaxID=502558 RepID=UPI0002171261|nr:AAA family ATPase [Eggerthella sp. YY7918]BAK44746.1 hypothetical protein EGYY_16060 [Eggerthella sp. YY7918]
MSFEWAFKVKGFGPFGNQANGTMRSNRQKPIAKVAVYSGNGQGKTCLSRLFRAAEVGANQLTDSNITRGYSSGSFEFTVEGSGGVKGSLRINKRSGNVPDIVNDTDLLFHVFNSDYVRDNLASLKYSPSGKIEGYIVGKENIDVTDQKKRLEELREWGVAKQGEIQTAIDQAQKTLLALGVSKQTAEFREMTYGKICELALSNNAYDEKLKEYEVLKGLPDDLAQLGNLKIEVKHIDLDGLAATLAKAHTRAAFSEDFLIAIKSKQDFAEEGLRLSGDGDLCPFCGQKYNDEARKLIHLYTEYLDGQEAKVISDLKAQDSQLAALRESYLQLIGSRLALVKEYDRRKPAFADFKETALPDIPAIEQLDAAIKSVTTLIEMKCQNISIEYNADAVAGLAKLLKSVLHTVEEINELVQSMNSSIQKIKTAKTSLRKTLCTEMAKKVRAEKDEAIEERGRILKEFEDLRNKIRNDESLSRRPKRDAVAEVFEMLLHRMFGDKYTFDKERFTILFGHSALNSDAEQILSDGEKSIVAFCHYVASTYECITEEEDAQKLFFVIDDPISSLDYHFVYSVVQTIKTLGMLFGINNKNLHILVMTHNSAFFNMLCRNKIVEAHYILHNGVLEQAKNSGIAPYAAHLKDIDAVFNGGVIAHTIGNSIRQVIEGLWRFDNPAASNLLDYLNSDECSDLIEFDYLYLLCNDQSHGALLDDRDQSIDEDSIRRACGAILNHIYRRYPGQLKAIDIVFNEQAMLQI